MNKETWEIIGMVSAVLAAVISAYTFAAGLALLVNYAPTWVTMVSIILLIISLISLTYYAHQKSLSK
jgi:hypothetical protein